MALKVDLNETPIPWFLGSRALDLPTETSVLWLVGGYWFGNVWNIFLFSPIVGKSNLTFILFRRVGIPPIRW